MNILETIRLKRKDAQKRKAMMQLSEIARRMKISLKFAEWLYNYEVEEIQWQEEK